MTAAPAGPVAPQLFTSFSAQYAPNHIRRDAFLFSLVGQALVIALIGYAMCCMIENTSGNPPRLGRPDEWKLIFSGSNGGGGGNFENLPVSRGNPPRASLDIQLAPPNVMQPTAMPRLAVEATVVDAPEIKIPEGGQIGDPNSQFDRLLSNGPGGPGGTGKGCCDGSGDSTGPHFGNGPEGIFPAGKKGVTVPQVIYGPEPGFSDEARKAKQQGTVQLLVVVGKDGRTSNIRVSQSLGMGLDEKAVEAVSHWRFRPATLNGKPVATEIAVEVDFHLY